LEQAYIAPRTPMEETLAAIWSQVLSVEKIGVQDNFFELGGHSLLATQVISRVREAFQVEVPLPTLIETPTISGLAEQIETIRWAAETTAAPEGHEDGEI
jgi:acyl carrier protein